MNTYSYKKMIATAHIALPNSPKKSARNAGGFKGVGLAQVTFGTLVS
ncbi:hypothetical protein [Acidovorax sp. LjRoot194]